MKKIYLQYHGFRSFGCLLSKYALEDETLLHGGAFVLKGKQILSVVHANDGGWVDKTGRVRRFERSGDSFFMGNLAVRCHVSFRRKAKVEA